MIAACDVVVESRGVARVGGARDRRKVNEGIDAVMQGVDATQSLDGLAVVPKADPGETAGLGDDGGTMSKLKTV